MSYRSHADLGGGTLSDRVVPEPEGEIFHAPWEPQALALTLAMGATGVWNLDMSRSARETLPNYRALSYYQIWLGGLERLLIGHGLVGADEIALGAMSQRPRAGVQVLRAADVSATMARGTPTERPAVAAPRFAVGDPVRTRSVPVDHHTRLPGYARGKVGRVAAVRGVHVFADTNAQGLGEQPQWLYSVAFSARELWGASGSERHSVSIDAWEPYLEALP